MDGKTISRESRTIRLTNVGFGETLSRARKYHYPRWGGTGHGYTGGKKRWFCTDITYFLLKKNMLINTDHHPCTSQKYI